MDLTKIPGVGPQTVLTLLAEVGTDLSRWTSAARFSSWLGLCPHNKISGGKILSSKSKRSANRGAMALRMAANSAAHTDSYLTEFLIRMKMRKGAAPAITATAHKLARIIWTCVTRQEEFKEEGAAKFQEQQRRRKEARLRRLARDLDITLPTKAA